MKLDLQVLNAAAKMKTITKQFGTCFARCHNNEFIRRYKYLEGPINHRKRKAHQLGGEDTNRNGGVCPPPPSLSFETNFAVSDKKQVSRAFIKALKVRVPKIEVAILYIKYS
jgi:hypothetical protein